MKCFLSILVLVFLSTGMQASARGKPSKEVPGAPAPSGKMSPDEIKESMRACMESQHDIKKCRHQTMDKCEKKMSKDDCRKTMKEMRSRNQGQKK